jgi:hypothetical protein
MTSFNLYEAYAAVYDESLRKQNQEGSLSFIDDLTDEDLDDVVEEVVGELIDDGFEFDEVQEIFEEVIGEDLEILEEIELVSEYLYECGFNEFGAAKILNDPNYYDIVESLFETEQLTEARSAKRRPAGGKTVEQIKAEIDAKEAAKKAKKPAIEAKVKKVKITQAPTAATSTVDKKDSIKDKTATSAYLEKRRAERAAAKNAPAAAEGEKIAKGRARNIRNIRIGKSVRKNIEKVKGGAKKVGRTLAAPARGGAGGGTSVVGRVSQASSAVSKGAEEIKAKAKRGLKGLISKGAEKLAGAASRVARGAEGVATRMKEDYDVFDCILEYLITEGYADTDESALVIMANMSEEWREEILDEEDKKLLAARKKSIRRLNAAKNIEDKQADGDYENPIDLSNTSKGKSGYMEVPTDYRARKRRASGR